MIKRAADMLYFMRGVIAIAHNWWQYGLFFLGVDRASTFLLSLRNGLQFRIRRGGGDMIAVFEDFYERQYFPESALIPKKLHIVLDIGTHIGTFSLLVHFVSHGRAKVYCYEPIAANFALLEQNTQRNHAHSLRLYHKAIWKNNKNQRIYFAGDSFLGSSLTEKSKRYETVSCETLQGVFSKEKITHCDLVKIDVEGAEYEILFSAPPSLFKRIDRLYVEYHADEVLLPKMERKLATFFHDKGYVVYRFTRRSILYAVKTPLLLPNKKQVVPLLTNTRL